MAVERIAGQGVWVTRPEGPADALMIHCTMARHEALLRLAGLRPEVPVLFDLPSHGRSDDMPEGRDVHDHVTAIAAALLPDGAHVIGHSFGATVALRLALETGRVRRLTLIEPVLFSAAKGSAAYHRHGRDYAPIDAAFAAGDDETALRVFLGLWGAGLPWEAMPDKLKREARRALHFLRDSEDAVHHDSPGLMAPGRLEALQIPVTLISGAQSHPVMADIHAGLSARLPDADVHVVAGAGHMVPITHPRDVAAIMAGRD